MINSRASPRVTSKTMDMGKGARLITKIIFTCIVCCVTTSFIRFVRATERPCSQENREMASGLHELPSNMMMVDDVSRTELRERSTSVSRWRAQLKTLRRRTFPDERDVGVHLPSSSWRSTLSTSSALSAVVSRDSRVLWRTLIHQLSATET